MRPLEKQLKYIFQYHFSSSVCW